MGKVLREKQETHARSKQVNVETPVGFCLTPSNEWLMNFKQRPPWPWANHPWPESPKVMAQFLAIDCRSQPNHSDFTVP